MEMEKEKKKEKTRPEWPRVYKLLDPIEWGNELITQLEFQKPKAKHIEQLDFSAIKTSDIIAITAKLTGTSTAALREMGVKDVTGVAGLLGELLEGSH